MAQDMPYHPDRHHRRSIRLPEYDYAGAGAYFVTVCASGHGCLFGEVRDGIMVLNRIGEMARDCWSAIPHHFDDVVLDQFVVMPNHIHGIVVMCDGGVSEATHMRATHASPLRAGPPPRSLGAVVGSFKSAVTSRVNELRGNAGCPVWQRNYFERVIRNERELAAIREYIANNPAKWAMDRENPANRGTIPHDP